MASHRYELALQVLQDCKGVTDLETEAGGCKHTISGLECVLYANRAVALGKLGRHEEALREAYASIQVQPGYAKGHHRVGSTLQALGREEAAQRSFRKSEELQREQARADAAAGSGAAGEDNLRFTDLTDGVDPLSWVAGRMVRADTGEACSHLPHLPASLHHYCTTACPASATCDVRRPIAGDVRGRRRA